MSNIITTLKVDKANAYNKNAVTLTSGMAGAKIQFIFSDEWTGLGRTAVFTSGTTTKYVILDSTNICTIPYECLTTARQMLVVGVYGTNGTTIVIPTVSASLGIIAEGTSVSGSEAGEITQSLCNQVTAMLNSANTELATIKETAIKSVNVDSTLANVTGTTSVELSTEWIDDDDHSKGKKATFIFKNLKGIKGDTGNSGVYIGSSTPTDSTVNVWIDTNGSDYEYDFDVEIYADYNSSHVRKGAKIESSNYIAFDDVTKNSGTLMPHLTTYYDYYLAVYVAPCKCGDKFIINGESSNSNSYPLYAFVQKPHERGSSSIKYNADVVSTIDVTTPIVANNLIVEAPKHAAYIVVQVRTDKTYSNLRRICDSNYDEQNTENFVINSYLKASDYDITDYSYTKVEDYYSSGVYDDLSQPVLIPYDYTQRDAAYVDVKFYDNIKENNSISKQFFNSGVVSYRNLTPNKRWYYKIYSSLSSGTILKTGYVLPKCNRRLIELSGVGNTRDLGGIKTADNSYIKFGRLYRGRRPDKIYDNTDGYLNFITTNAITEATSAPLSINTQFDLRTASSESTNRSAFGFTGDHYQQFGITNFSTTDLSRSSETIKNAFTALANRLRAGDIIFFHCTSGADRTGFFAWMIEAICNCRENEMVHDYELTSFATDKRERCNDSSGETFTTFIENWHTLNGTTSQEKAYTYLVTTCGMSADDFYYIHDTLVY